MLQAACSSIPERNPIPAELGPTAKIAGIEHARYWGDEVPYYFDRWLTQTPDQNRARYPGIMDKEHNYLVLSGGGQNGAFGAGLLAGWTQAGTRPEFEMVTGVSAGALIAPFAFLGSGFDDDLREAFTTHSTPDFINKRGMFAIFRQDALADPAPLRAMLAHYITDEVVERIADESRGGRALLIGTTNLDADRPVIWNLGTIAMSEHAHKRDLILDILIASASIPGAFPPVMFDVEADDGETYDEMHVDGGVTRQAFLYPLNEDWKVIVKALNVRGKPSVYVIRNGHFSAKWQTVERKIMPMAARSISSLTRTQGVGDTYRFYLAVIRDNLEFNLVSIPEDFPGESREPFDRSYMNQLYDLGFQMTSSGDPWLHTPPLYDGWESEDPGASTE